MSSSPPPAVQGSILEGLFAQGPASEPTLTARLKPLGFDVHDIQESYPPNVFGDCLEVAAEHLWPELPLDDGLRRLGALTIPGFQRTVLGSITLAAIKLMGPERLIRQLPKRFISGQNYGSGAVSQVGPRHWELHYLDLPPGVHPHVPFVCGAIQAAMELTGVREVKVRPTREVPNGFVMEITWAA